MENEQQAKRLREMMRLLVRKLGFLERGEASCCNITISQCHALIELGRAGRLSLVDLAANLNLDKSTVSRSVDNLVGQGLLLRETDPEDRRFVTLRLTEQGESTYREMETRMENFFQDIIDAIPEEKREQVIDSVHCLTEAVHGSNCCS